MIRPEVDNTTRITVLETRMGEITRNMDKLETTVSDNYTTLHEKVNEMRDDFRDIIEEKHDKIITKLDAHSNNSHRQYQIISDKIQMFESWRWMIIGAAAVVGYVLANIKFDRLF